jgi:hypothetical protein
VILLLAQLLLAMNVSAVIYDVGVKPGDWLKYYYDWMSEVATQQEIEKANQVSYSLIEVKEVSNTTNVKVQETTFFKNGSKAIKIYIGDIKTGVGNLSVQVISSNLVVGDMISEAPDAPSINRTEMKKYAGATREINSLGMGTVETGEENLTQFSFYWDKKTGILCEMIILRYRANVTTGNYETISRMRWNIFETSLWKPETSIEEWLVVVIFAIIIGGVALFFMFRKSSGKRLRRRRSKNARINVK